MPNNIDLESLGGAYAVDKEEEANKIQMFAKKLYDWFNLNPNFYSGDITVIGNPKFQIGEKLYYHDYQTDTKFKYYIESVEHKFSMQEGYQTTLGVTRGLITKDIDDEVHRFNPPQGKAEDFKGGYLGEASFEQLTEYRTQLDQSKKDRQQRIAQNALDGLAEGLGTADYGTNGVTGVGGKEGARMIAQIAVNEWYHNRIIYRLGGGHGSNNVSNPLDKQGTIYLDCSSFVNWVCAKAGYKLHSSDILYTRRFHESPILQKLPSNMKPSDFIPGDIVLTHNMEHVVLVTKKGQVTHCTSDGMRVRQDKFTGSGDYGKNFNTGVAFRLKQFVTPVNSSGMNNWELIN